VRRRVAARGTAVAGTGTFWVVTASHSFGGRAPPDVDVNIGGAGVTLPRRGGGCQPTPHADGDVTIRPDDDVTMPLSSSA